MQKPKEKKPLQAREGLVVSYFGNSVAVETSEGQIFQCHLRRNQELPVVGDKVNWLFEQEGMPGTIVSILPRQSMLARGDNAGKMKPIAANIDVILIVMSPPPIFSEYLVDRYLIAAELLSLPAIIVLNKIDLLEGKSEEEAENHLSPYRQIPYPVILSSIYKQSGLDELTKILSNKRGVLIGPSGVGKSSIIAGLSQSDIKTGEVTAKGIGKHTTTATRLYHLPQGGSLIDSPGVREFNLWSVSRADILRGFKEFAPFLTGCRFRDCQHLVEPGCSVQKAVSDGKINAQRYANYQQLMKKAKNTP